MDATGGLAFTLASTPLIPPDELQLAQDVEIAEEISRIERTKNIWWDEIPCPVLPWRRSG